MSDQGSKGGRRGRRGGGWSYDGYGPRYKGPRERRSTLVPGWDRCPRLASVPSVPVQSYTVDSDVVGRHWSPSSLCLSPTGTKQTLEVGRVGYCVEDPGVLWNPKEVRGWRH